MVDIFQQLKTYFVFGNSKLTDNIQIKYLNNF